MTYTNIFEIRNNQYKKRDGGQSSQNWQKNRKAQVPDMNYRIESSSGRHFLSRNKKRKYKSRN